MYGGVYLYMYVGSQHTVKQKPLKIGARNINLVFRDCFYYSNCSSIILLTPKYILVKTLTLMCY